MSGRLEQLWSIYREEPGDPFNLYALGLEYLKSDPQKARELFFKLLEEHPGYLPVYYMSAELLISLEEIDLANKVILDGLRAAKKLHNTKAYSELKNLQMQIDPGP